MMHVSLIITAYKKVFTAIWYKRHEKLQAQNKDTIRFISFHVPQFFWYIKYLQGEKEEGVEVYRVKGEKEGDGGV